MAPFSMRCNACGEYIYKGKKFNARKETALGEDYMGIKVRSSGQNQQNQTMGRRASALLLLCGVHIRTFPNSERSRALRPFPDLPLLYQVHALLDRDHIQDGPQER